MMKKRGISILLAACLLCGLLSGCTSDANTDAAAAAVQARLAEQGETLVLASYNTAAPWGSLLKGTSSKKRVALFAKQMQAIAPDSFGVQEINAAWVEQLKTLLPQYAYYGVPRGGDKDEKRSEMSGVFYLQEKYTPVESDTFWISETPEQMSAFEGAGCNRVCSYVVLENKTTGFTYAHFNTHLDNVSEAARTLGGELLVQRTAEITKKYGESLFVAVTGDFNQNADGTVCAALQAAGFENASAGTTGADAQLTYHAWGEHTEGGPIDFIFTTGPLHATAYTVHSEKMDGTYVSDHFCISATLSAETT